MFQISQMCDIRFHGAMLRSIVLQTNPAFSTQGFNAASAGLGIWLAVRGDATKVKLI